jgi:Acyl-CoA thioesterase C-terminal domain/Acyl-CoA thioesterase N-terminal domain
MLDIAACASLVVSCPLFGIGEGPRGFGTLIDACGSDRCLLALRRYRLSVADAFYVPDGDRFAPTPWTRGPWDPNAQHAGPPAALVARAVEGFEPDGRWQVARFTLEVLRPIPLTALRIDARVVRPGKRVQFAEASLVDERAEVARASVWRIRASDQPVPAAGQEPPPFDPPLESQPLPVFEPPWEGESYFAAMEWRRAAGAFFEPGPAALWMRARIPLVEGEETSPLARVLVVADSGNGISSVSSPLEYLFINTELTVHLFRLPVGEWVCLDAVSRIDPSGVGVAESILWDEVGRIGRANQALLVAPRER